MPRRRFLRRALAAGALVANLTAARLDSLARAGADSPLRAAIIGHTGRGDFGHELDLVFNGHPGIELTAVADPVAAGRAKAAARSRAPRQYADYREMLEKERPRLVAVGLRHTDQHHAILSAVLKSGAHVLVEKPFAQTLDEADDLLALARQAGLRIAVAHQARLSPSIQHLLRGLEAGLIGPLVQVRSWGKQDSRAGGEDMIVLGTHLFDLIRLFAGDAAWCTAQLRYRNREASRADIRTPTENIGPVLGDEIEAQFAMANGIRATFTSSGRLRQTLGPWGLTLVGEKGMVRILMDIAPRIFVLKPGAWEAAGATEAWQALPGDPLADTPADDRGFPAANRRVLDDWLQAIAMQREPVCSGTAGMKAIELAMGVFEAGLRGGRVAFPLANRHHPLR